MSASAFFLILLNFNFYHMNGSFFRYKVTLNYPIFFKTLFIDKTLLSIQTTLTVSTF